MNHRIEVSREALKKIVDEVIGKLESRLVQKGRGVFISAHEIVGSLEEEMLELKQAVHSKDEAGTALELIDVAVGAIFGVASLRAIREFLNATVDPTTKENYAKRAQDAIREFVRAWDERASNSEIKQLVESLRLLESETL